MLNVYYSLVFIILINNVNIGYQSNVLDSGETIEMMLSDYKSAFQILTNDTMVLNNIIMDLEITSASMYIIFQLPNSSDSRQDSMRFLLRNDFMEPTFPSVTNQYMEIAKQRMQRVMRNFKYNNAEKDSWSLLGLDGWQGEISHPISLFETNFSDTIIKDEEYLEDSNEINAATYDDNNIFIARANNRFGHSTMWELRNTSTSNGEKRPKRDAIKLYSMIKCSTGCDPLLYKGYGCYCGFLGRGIPVNGIDRCCRLHDICYDRSNCISYLEYFVPYIWKCYHNKPLCAISHGEWGGPHSCAARLCYCDLRLSRCLRKFPCPRRNKAVCLSSPLRNLQNLLYFK